MMQRADLTAWVDRRANAVTLGFLSRKERGEWFILWEQLRYGLSPLAQQRLIQLTTIGAERAAEYFTGVREVEMVMAYDFRILASMTLDQLWRWQEHMKRGNTNKAHLIYENAARILLQAENLAKRTV